MRWQGRRGSRNVVDRRGGGGGARVGGFGLVIVVLVGLFFGVDLTPLMEEMPIGGRQDEISQADERAAKFVSVALADTEEVWADIFEKQLGERYEPPTLVLFSGVTQSACGGAQSATGPFYCPNDRRIYLDADFFATMERELGAGGDFAAAYVVAHEVAHHVQNELGILQEANRIRAQLDRESANALSVRIELQADCLAGLWANHADRRFQSLERGDIAEAMNAAEQIGDDTLQRRQTGTVRPHTFTHGTSTQRQEWFERGLRSGDLGNCDTFGAGRL